MSRVFINEDGEYLTRPDGDRAKLSDIFDYEFEKRGFT